MIESNSQLMNLNNKNCEYKKELEKMKKDKADID